MVSIASLLGARHLREVGENKPASSLVVFLVKAFKGTPHLHVEERYPEMETPKRLRSYRPKHSDTSLSREWRINMVNKKKIANEQKIVRVKHGVVSFPATKYFFQTKCHLNIQVISFPKRRNIQ